MSKKACFYCAAFFCAVFLAGRQIAVENRQAAQERQLGALTRQIGILWRQPYRITVNVQQVQQRQAELPGFAEMKREGRP